MQSNSQTACDIICAEANYSTFCYMLRIKSVIVSGLNGFKESRMSNECVGSSQFHDSTLIIRACSNRGRWTVDDLRFYLLMEERIVGVELTQKRHVNRLPAGRKRDLLKSRMKIPSVAGCSSINQAQKRDLRTRRCRYASEPWRLFTHRTLNHAEFHSPHCKEDKTQI